MKITLTSLTIVLISIGLFSFFQTEKKIEVKDNKLILGMVLLDEPNSVDITKVTAELRNKWHLTVDEQESDTETAVLTIEGYTIAIGTIPKPIPGEEVKRAASYSYFWKKGVEEASQHKAHIILSILNAGKNPIQENLLYSKVAAAVLANSNSSGIYLGGRTLLLKKDFYLDNAETMTEEDLPLYNWVYFGLRQENGKQSVYTYGLSDFNKLEMEIVNSNHSFEELSDMMYNLCATPRNSDH
ncbi:DUF4261 domain-containing protein [Rhodocytophaga aerolata]|uniref:DUF4261 domain-containing protein n=1 Tax=Rhodocytophaga aerolata TaxID=455078 RepID=A0ABT8RI75_9BACT|nr:DUF4261 domain-containing protein [Rhodocytophaga aerolata]MDO1451669.1 DUF4261 domain-containing protein [Rhodocytophaga aerolata]